MTQRRQDQAFISNQAPYLTKQASLPRSIQQENITLKRKKKNQPADLLSAYPAVVPGNLEIILAQKLATTPNLTENEKMGIYHTLQQEKLMRFSTTVDFEEMIAHRVLLTFVRPQNVCRMNLHFTHWLIRLQLKHYFLSYYICFGRIFINVLDDIDFIFNSSWISETKEYQELISKRRSKK
ncbi:hypothetical protein MXB_2609 [Myxobolus squamalis]|nr:hypothetical protein MXB_2609 [Myxobolus squamalis]